ncbi:SH2 domain-containing protein 1B [Pteronotus mesoamericanus]|uniref:SH2 domain-containing protein 1B n=1 Tax=Pteronotus mesoamericanus TaxID=1884717 RepID=UPI0023EAF12E|nr:SH2 domain-containing protein 1B [Pteronotus parnellii mesoamericanus]
MDLPYYHGALSKKACEGLLLTPRADGNFLLRDSESMPGALCLCVSFKNVVYTYRIFREKYGQYRIQTVEGAPKETFSTLRELVSKFKKPNQGLVFPLRTPIERARPRWRQRSSNVDVDEDKDYENCSNDYVTVLP